MSTYLYPLIALLAGAAIGAQISMNARLGVLLKSPIFGTFAVVSVSATLTLLAAMATRQPWPGAALMRKVPPYLWLSGGALSAAALWSFYSIAPQMGVGKMVSYALTGQLCIAVAAAHWGWFAMPVERVGIPQWLGLGSMIFGLFCMNAGRT